MDIQDPDEREVAMIDLKMDYKYIKSAFIPF